VIVALGIIGILAILALVFEFGTLTLSRRDGQNQSDLASLAGTHVIAQVRTGQTPPHSVRTAISSSLQANGCSVTAGCTWVAEYVDASLSRIRSVGTGSPPRSAFGVRVGVTRTVDTTFGRIFPQPILQWTISTEATALTARGSVLAANTVLPMAICGWESDSGETDCGDASDEDDAIDFQHGQVYDLAEGKDGPFGFGWLSWTGGNLSSSICTPDNPALTLGDPYTSDGGEVWVAMSGDGIRSSAVRSCLQQWINAATTVLVPVYDVADRGGTGRYHLTGVAAFVLTSIGTAADDTVSGAFVEYYPYANLPGAEAWELDEGDTTYFIGLVR
jgi:hypothetical protein